MRFTVAVRGDGADGVLELRRWLAAEPELRGRVRSGQPVVRRRDVMGTASDALTAVLEPGGVATVFAGALVAWLHSRRSNQTVTVTRPDGTEITVSSTRVRSLDAASVAELVRQLAATDPPGDCDSDSGTDAEGDPGGAMTGRTA
ncbi:hypothetical protein SAMN06297387_10218 [Streptomyces zhaozhouensis]|uniref:Uncharacterized protein n=1 Tax=Streptomyces zhaozhouensis TaxID=1300267 RepID=A0A286DNB7_9ACTN|nr:hypothetical protein [Streptomyces zhaozhouensis]SOD60113.1 hypothetical protein SAMN06297387_10218 [Streptomyces zhaozhouensis]